MLLESIITVSLMISYDAILAVERDNHFHTDTHTHTHTHTQSERERERVTGCICALYTFFCLLSLSSVTLPGQSYESMSAVAKLKVHVSSGKAKSPCQRWQS